MHANVEPIALDLQLPWQETPEQEEKFKRLLKRILIVLAVIGLIVPWLPVFEQEYDPTAREITRTKVVMEPIEVEEPELVKPPEPEPVKPEPKPQPEPEPPEQLAQETAPAPPPQPKNKDDVAREQGLAKLGSQLSALRSNVDVKKLQRKNVDKSNLGQVEHSTREAFGEDVAARRSRGIQVDDVTMNEERVSLADYSGVSVEATTYSDQPGGSQLSYLSAKAGRRDMENIRRTFEAAKNRVYSLYLQALNDHPDLRGKFIFRLVIQPDGSISELKLITSELNMRQLEVAILERIKTINFGAREVSPTAVEYAFSFLPS